MLLSQFKMRGTGRILITIDAVEHEEGVYYKVDFEDDGLGVAEEHMERLFHPNFTTKAEVPVLDSLSAVTS